MSNEVKSTAYESWIINMAANQGANRKRIMGAFAAVLGDKSVNWLTQVLLEHMPSFAQSSESIALMASERQLDTQPGEASSALAAREPYWLQLARFKGSGLGVLLGLHFAGFDGAILVQQNGRALQLTLPLPPFVTGQAWDPSTNLVVTPCAQLAVALTSSVTPSRSIPAGTPWWMVDSDTDFCSRFAVLFPTPPSLYPFSASDLARLQATIKEWRCEKASCVGIRVLTSGRMWGWPPTQKWADLGATWGGTVVVYAGA